ncbi:hypothetical protein SUNI508_03901 [Seiridium unicorne]|uniref:GEgh 16 protein n=1 Tax=Seiridium unicorne TaxID=138068 RepID=A0ABR2VBM9_9PEZI
MFPIRQAVVVSALLAMANGQNIISAQGTKNSNTSQALQGFLPTVDLTDPNDMNIIKTSEISSNIVNQCGRTVNGGNIDVGAKTEDALASGNVTQVTKGSDVTVTMSANSTMASGSYTCDLDPQGNVQGATGQTALQSTQKTAKSSKNGNKNNNRRLVVRQSVVARANKATGSNTMTLTVTMPDDLACIGASQGNVCTVRCINDQEVGGCFAVQQTDTTPLDGNNSPDNISTSQAADAITKQIAQNKQDLPTAEKAIADVDADALTDEGKQNAAVVAAIISADPATSSQTATSNSNSGKKNKGNNAGTQGKTGGGGNNKRSTSGSRWAKRRSYEVLTEE